MQSGLFSGLNLGLMSLDQTELKIVQNTGTDREKGYATVSFSLVSKSTILLCSSLPFHCVQVYHSLVF